MVGSGDGGARQLEGVATDRVTGAVTATALRLLRDQVGPGGVEQALHVAGLVTPPARLADARHWIGHDDVVALLFAAGAMSAEPDFVRRVGEALLFGDDALEVAAELRAAGSPAAALDKAHDLGAAFSTASTLDPVEIGPSQAVLRSQTQQGAIRHHFLCELTRGMLSRVPLLFGLAPAEVDEPECQARGGAYCEYHLTWDSQAAAGTTGLANGRAPAAVGAAPERELRARLTRMGRTLDDIAATASDVRGGAALSDLLARTARRAARAVGAPRYVLVVRPGPERPVELHQHGFDEQEAWELAQKLWRPAPGGDPGDQLVVDVASVRRTYGRLAAFFPSPSAPAADDRALFSLYAGLAATAMDLAQPTEAGQAVSPGPEPGAGQAVSPGPEPGAGQAVSPGPEPGAGQAVSPGQVEQAGTSPVPTEVGWHDDVTGGPGRLLLLDRLERELERAQRMGGPPALVVLDVDRFAEVNDALGRQLADALLGQAGRRLRDLVEPRDTVARLGADVFAALLAGPVDAEGARLAADRMLEAFREPFRVGGTELRLSASAGVALGAGSSPAELRTAAAQAMRRAKESGGDALVVASGATEIDTRHQGGVEAELRAALDSGELFVLYQPFIDLDTAEVVGVEALVRWRHPTRGVLEPAAFLPAAERSNLIVDVDLFVLREACRQLRQWADSGVTPLRMAVNVAARDLLSPSFADAVTEALRESGVPPMWIELEMGQSMDGDPDGAVRRTAEQLRQLGVRFSVSEFGTGVAALQQVATFPVRTLKLGRTFVQMLGPDDELGALVSAIVAMAERLGFECMAEGVESSQQSRVLLQRGCTTAQGYFFSPPLFPDDVKRMLQSPLRGRARRVEPGRPSGSRPPGPTT